MSTCISSSLWDRCLVVPMMAVQIFSSLLRGMYWNLDDVTGLFFPDPSLTQWLWSVNFLTYQWIYQSVIEYDSFPYSLPSSRHHT
ncbi:hypothetical protein BDZ94DRAFT_1270479 [Collybia nuda]|uniref:Uncharacterized protein n=1 Tax=Collybia nuda TaxID=64659 RepID=A0A9P6CF16_9AGAR|nr:hypothetical protein BDZ94DRAFT_1270479 [Collybia nuda]